MFNTKPTQSSIFLEGRTITRVLNNKDTIELHLDNKGIFKATAVSISSDGVCGLNFTFDRIESPIYEMFPSNKLLQYFAMSNLDPTNSEVILSDS